MDGFNVSHKFWLPLLALFTGARMEEMCQLRASQVNQVDGVWCLNIAQEYPDQSVKTAEDRIVPLHPFRIDQLGFHHYALSRAPEDRIFPDLKRVNDRWGHYASRDFRTFKKACGIDAPKNTKVFHSFRHNVETILQDLEVDQKYINQLTGHAEKGESARYGKPNIELIYERAVLALPWPKKLALEKIKSRWARQHPAKCQ